MNLTDPFPPEDVSWKPGASANGKVMALAYADLRTYQDRLDDVIGQDWGVTYTPWGEDKVICHLTVRGVTRSSTGEGSDQAERNENEGTVAEAQAFKRACAMFGLGRYLYRLPRVWVEANGKGISDKGKAELDQRYRQWYERITATQQPTASKSVQRRVEIQQAAAHRQPEPASDYDAELEKLFDKTPPNINPWAGVTEGCKNWGAQLRQLHTDSDRTCSEKQYQFLAGLIDKLSEKGAHRDILCRLAGDDVDAEKRPGSKMASELFDKLAARGKDGDNPNWSKQHENYIKELWTALQLAAIPA